MVSIGPVVGGGQAASHAPILIGAEYVDAGQAAAFGTAVGYAINLGPVQQEQLVLRDYVNAHGGLNGHPISLVQYKNDFTQANAQSSNAACQTWTQDRKVVIAMTLFLDTKACLAKAKVAHVQSNAIYSTVLDRDYAKYPLMVNPNGMALDRLAQAYAKHIGDTGFFQSPAPMKLGVLYNDTPDYRAAYAVLKQTLASQGIQVTADAAVPPFLDTDVGPLASAVSNAVLKFNTNGVNHVMFLDNAGAAATVFMAQAKSQQYYPRYGLQGNDGPALIASHLNGDKTVLHAATFVGWSPVFDTYLPTDYETPAARRCLKIYADAHLQIPAGENSVGTALINCDMFLYLRDAIAAGGGNVDAAAFQAGVQQLGSHGGWAAGATFGSQATAARRDGVQTLRVGGFVDSCACFTYQKPKVRI